MGHYSLTTFIEQMTKLRNRSGRDGEMAYRLEALTARAKDRRSSVPSTDTAACNCLYPVPSSGPKDPGTQIVHIPVGKHSYIKNKSKPIFFKRQKQTFFFLCHVCQSVCTCVCVYHSLENLRHHSSVTVHLAFFQRGPLINLELKRRLDWLVCEPPGSTCFNKGFPYTTQPLCPA